MSEKIELSEDAYKQIERMKEANLYYDGYVRLIQRLRNEVVRGNVTVDRDELNSVANDLLEAHHRLIGLLDYPYELHIPNDSKP